MSLPSVAWTSDFQRVASLPRRTWSPEDLEHLADALTTILKTSSGSMRLRPVQAQALYEAGTEGGLFGPIGVGEGKTVISLLLPVVMFAKRPLLLLPAALISKTQTERLALSKHWRIPSQLRLFSYEMLGRVQAQDELHQYRPDVIIADECHRLKGRRAAVTRRVLRYFHDHPDAKFAGLSGTVMSHSVRDFAHLLLLSLKNNAPVPLHQQELDEWAEVLDESVDPLAQRKPGALLEFCNFEEKTYSPHIAARHGFRRRMTETPGVVATVGEGEHIDCSIYVRSVTYDVTSVTDQYIARLRKEWVTPDDWALMMAAEVWSHAQQMALGLYYMWDPRPPPEWREARKAWNQFVRETISRSKTYDSELHVANGCDAGQLDASALNGWRRVKPTFTPNVVPIWFDESAVESVAKWMSSPGVVWTEHRFFAEHLAQLTGHAYFGAGGRDATGRPIEEASPKECVIASIDANREGRNLQRLWHRNLMVCPPSSAAWWEQVVARTHRPGQPADEVIVDVMLGCRENWDACIKAVEGAKAIQQVTGKRQKLLLADVTFPSELEIESRKGARWQR